MAALRFKTKFRLVFVMLVFLFLIAASVVTAYLVRFSATQEIVCRQCHPELSELWRSSKGHPADQTRCFECHSPKPDLKPRGWNVLRHFRDQLAPPEYLADDELTSSRCLDCHNDVLFLGYKVKKKVVRFNHRIHSMEGLDCIDCHRTAGHEYMMRGTNRATILECLNCHLREFEGPPRNQKCLNCHDVMLAPGKTW